MAMELFRVDGVPSRTIRRVERCARRGRAGELGASSRSSTPGCSFRGGYSEVLSHAFRSAFGTDSSAAALDRVDAHPEREDGEPRPFASAEDLRDAATNWRSMTNVRMDNLRRVKDELSEARAEVERLNAQMGEPRGLLQALGRAGARRSSVSALPYPYLRRRCARRRPG